MFYRVLVNVAPCFLYSCVSYKIKAFTFQTGMRNFQGSMLRKVLTKKVFPENSRIFLLWSVDFNGNRNRISFVQGVHKQCGSPPLITNILAESGISLRLSCVDAVIRWQSYINKAFVWVVKLGHILAMPQIAPVYCWRVLTWRHAQVRTQQMHQV